LGIHPRQSKGANCWVYDSRSNGTTENFKSVPFKFNIPGQRATTEACTHALDIDIGSIANSCSRASRSILTQGTLRVP